MQPLYTAAGNHDVESNSETGEMFMSYEARFLMPQIAQAQIGKATHADDFDLNKMYQLVSVHLLYILFIDFDNISVCLESHAYIKSYCIFRNVALRIWKFILFVHIWTYS